MPCSVKTDLEHFGPCGPHVRDSHGAVHQQLARQRFRGVLNARVEGSERTEFEVREALQYRRDGLLKLQLH